MYLDLLKKMNEYDIKKWGTPLFNEPPTEESVQKLINDSQTELNYTPCEEYLNFLRLADEFDSGDDEGINFFSTDDFVGSNLDWRGEDNDDKYIIFGSYASYTLYCYNPKEDYYGIGDRFYINQYGLEQLFNTFDELISAAVKQKIHHIMLIELLVEANDNNDLKLNHPQSDEDIELFIKKTKSTLDYEPDGLNNHLNMISLCNGIKTNKLTLYNNDDFIRASIDARLKYKDRSQILVFGESDEAHTYIFNEHEVLYQIICNGNLNDVLRSYQTYSELMINVLQLKSDKYL